MKKNALNLVMAIVVSGMALSANAKSVLVNFSGAVTSIESTEPSGSLWFPFTVGQEVTGSYTYESATPNIYGYSISGGYDNALTHLDLNLDGYAVQSNRGHIEIANNYYGSDIYRVSTNYILGLNGTDIGDAKLYQFYIEFYDPIGNALSDNLLSDSLPNPLNFISGGYISYSKPSFTGNTYFSGRIAGVRFSIDSFEIGDFPPNVLAVPEPETYGMMLMGIGMIGFMARRQRANKPNQK